MMTQSFRMRWCYLVQLACIGVWSTSGFAQEIEVVYPPDWEDVEGGSQGDYESQGARYQQVNLGFERFPDLPDTHRWISGFRWRPDSSLTAPESVTWEFFTLRLSTTLRAPGSLSNRFVDNIGPDETLVYDGPITLSTMNTGPAEGPKDFDVVFDFQRLFYYDSAQGHLLIDLVLDDLTGLISTDSCGCVTDRWLMEWKSSTDGEPFAEVATNGTAGGSITQFIFVSLSPGDFNHNRLLDVEDIDLLTTETHSETPSLEFDLNNDTAVNSDDREVWVEDLKNTWFGDSNLDGEFNSGDMVQVFVGGKYETDESVGWADGDWNGDFLFDSGDMVLAFSKGGYEQGKKEPAAAVPEPSGVLLLLMSLSVLVGTTHRR